MAEDREEASPGDKEEDEFEVLDEVGEVEGWDEDLLPDGDEEQDMDVEDSSVKVDEKNAPSSSDTKSETDKTDSVSACAKSDGTKNELPTTVDKNSKVQSEKCSSDQTSTDKSSESSADKGKKSSLTDKSGTPDDNQATSHKDEKVLNELASKDGTSSGELASKVEKSSNEANVDKDKKSPTEVTVSKDGKVNEAAVIKEQKLDENSVSQNGESLNACPASKDGGKSVNESPEIKDGKLLESSDKEKKSSSNEPSAEKGVTINDKSSSKKDENSSGKEGALPTDHSSATKDKTSHDRPSSGKDSKRTDKDVSSGSPDKKAKTEDKKKTDGKAEDKKRTEGKVNDSRNQSKTAATKRKSDDKGDHKSGEKKIKLSSDRADYEKQKICDDDIEELLTADPKKEHAMKKEQFVNKMVAVCEELKRLRDFRRWSEKNRKDGMLFPLFEPKQSDVPVLFSRCQLISGYEKDANKLCLGIRRHKNVRNFWACEEKFVPTVRRVVKEFEELVQSSGKPLFDPTSQQGYWQSMGVLANSEGRAILQVHLHAADDSEGEARFAEVKKILLDRFKRKKLEEVMCVSCIYLRLALSKKSSSTERTANTCIMGTGSLYEEMKGVNINIYPWSYFSTGTTAMTALCEELQTIFTREHCDTLVEIGCGTGIVGQVLSKSCKTVIGVDTTASIKDAKENAMENKLNNCKYFDGKVKDAVAAIDKEIRSGSLTLVIVNTLCYELAEDSAILDWLRRSDKVHKVVYIKSFKDTDKTFRLTYLCSLGKEVRHHRDDQLPYLPLYAVPVDLGTKSYAILVVLKHVEKNFVSELYKLRDNYKVKCIQIAISGNSKPFIVTDETKDELKSNAKNVSAKNKNSQSKSNNQNSKLKTSKKRGRPRSSGARSKLPGSKDDSQDKNRTNVRSGAKNLRSGGNEHVKRSPKLGRNDQKKHEETNRISRNESQLRGANSRNKRNAPSSGPRNVWMNKDGLLTTRIDGSRQGGALPPRDLMSLQPRDLLTLQPRDLMTLQPRDLRNVLQSRPGHYYDGPVDSGRHADVRDLRMVLQGKRMHAEKQPEVSDNVRADRFIHDVIHDARHRKAIDSLFTHDIAPPGTEDLRHVLQEKKVMVEGDRNVHDRDFHSRSTGDSRGHYKVWEKQDLRSFIEENRAAHKTVGKESFREVSKVPNDTALWGGSRTESFRNVPVPGGNLYPSNVWDKKYSKEEPEAFPLVKDSALFEQNSSANLRDDRKVMFADFRDTRNVSFNLHGSRPGRSFDDAEVGRRTRARVDDIASGIKTDVRGINIRNSTWKFRDLRPTDRSLDLFNKFDTHAGLKDNFQHGWKGRQEFDRPPPNAVVKGDRRALSPSPKRQRLNDVLRKDPYHKDDRPNLYDSPEKSSKSNWLPFDFRNRSSLGAAEGNRNVFEAERAKMKFDEVDVNRTIMDGSERSRIIEESADDRRTFSGPERRGVNTGGFYDGRNMIEEPVNKNMYMIGPENRNRSDFKGPEGRKRLDLEGPKERNRPGFSEHERNRSDFEEINRPSFARLEDRNMSGFGGHEDRNRPSLKAPDDRSRSGFGAPEDGSRSGFGPPDDRRSGFSGHEDRTRSHLGVSDDRPIDRSRSGFGGPEGSNKSDFNGPEDRNRLEFSGSHDRNRIMYGGSESRTDDRNRLAFNEMDNRNRIIGKVDRNAVNVELPERNKAVIEEMERNRIRALKTEIDKYVGPTGVSRPDYHATEAKNVAPDYHNTRGYEDKHFIGDESMKSTLYNVKQSLEPRSTQMYNKQSGKDDKEKITDHGRSQKVFDIPVLQREYNSQGRGKKSPHQSALKYRNSPAYEGRASEKQYVEDPLQNRDAKNSYLRDRLPPEKTSSYWNDDKGRDPGNNQSPSSTNRMWERMEQDGNLKSSSQWAGPYGRSDKQDIQGRVGNAQNLTRHSQHIEPKQQLHLPSQLFGDRSVQSRVGSVAASGPAAFASTPQLYEQALQQLLSSTSIPLPLSGMLPAVNLANVHALSSLPGSNSADRSVPSSSRAFPWLN